MTKTGYRFDEVARSERHFTSFILPLLLSHDDFFLLKKLFIEVYKEKLFGLKDDYEIVTELDPLRDGSVYHKKVKEIFKQFKRVAVPDLFLRWDNKVIIIEAKFFTSPKSTEIEAQMAEQKKAIEKVLSETKYNKAIIKYVALTIKGLKLKEYISLTWEHVFEMAETMLTSKPTQILYALTVLKDAIERAKKESISPDNHFKKYKSLQEVLNDLTNLIHDGNVYFGFSEGEGLLRTMTLEDLEKRNHYKVSDVKISDNWLPIDQLIKRYIELKYSNESE